MAVVIAASTSPIASSGRSAADSSEPAVKRRKRPKAVAPLPTSGTEVCRKRIFLDLFAGDGGLGKAVGRFMEVVLDDPFTVGDTDFLDQSAVDSLRDRCAAWHAQGVEIYFNAAPPCSSFSRARDRSARTRLRSTAHPGGLKSSQVVETGNTIARRTAELVTYLVNDLEARGSWEQPVGSYMLKYLDSIGALDGVERGETVLHQCRYGRAYRKPTVFYTFGGLKLPSLAKRCTQSESCGRPFHLQLGFGDLSTHDAAVYPRQLCAAYAADLRRDADLRDLALTAHRRLEGVSAGHVRRHVDRGVHHKSARERRDDEDLASRAGALETGGFYRISLFPPAVLLGPV